MSDAIVILELTHLVHDPENANQHSDINISQIAASIERFGFLDPIGVVPLPDDPATYMIVEGHGRHMAAQRLGLEEVPCIVLSLSEAQRRGYAIAHNQIQRLAPLDNEIIAEEFVRLDVQREDYMSLGMTEEDAMFTLAGISTVPSTVQPVAPDAPTESTTVKGEEPDAGSDITGFIPPVHRTTLRFASDVGYSRFTEFLSALRGRYPLAGTMGERIQLFLSEHGLISEGVPVDG